MINLKKETLEEILDSNHKIEDVMFVGSYDGKYRMNINEFLLKSDFDYDNGYGSAKIATDLIVYFDDKTYLSRWEYDGSEGWKYNMILDYKRTDDYKRFDILGGKDYMWSTVREMNRRNKNNG